MCNHKVVFYTPENKTNTKSYFRTPGADIVESSDSFTIHLNLPGVKKEDLEITVVEQLLTVTGKLKRALKEGEQYLINEIRHAGYQRKFKLAESIETENIAAEFSDGVLSIALAKKPEIQPRTINIK
ncbi:MAG: Hsp20/alpha crystallin family protein [Ignavibacteriales bacterium]|nr:Hsp20/alpha crystallin family protein [Ignavibacteriales bacterium]